VYLLGGEYLKLESNRILVTSHAAKFLEAASKSGFWFEIRSSLFELRPTGKAGPMFSPRTYASVS
jgi:hypothetical protein